ncbi:MAG TPA: polysaccharide biosynthesis C-terminal domain-containing protein [Terriglobales bacterium]|nr:polysaccharide biosynthesis C-terminal domain-containing protein [Terriglobales bacterium]
MNPEAPAAPSTPATEGESRRTHRAVATWLTGASASVLVALAGFIATPYLVRWLGDAPWGAWTVIGEWLGYLGLTQLALGPGALAIFLLRAHTTGAPGALTAMAKRGVRLYTLAAVALIPLAAALAWWAPLSLHARPDLTAALRWAVAIAALGSLALAPSQLFRSVLETVQRGYLVRAALLVQSLLITGLSLWWVWARWGIVGMAAANIMGMVVGAGIWLWCARRWLPGWRTAPPAPLTTKEVWNYNWPLIVALAGNQINALTDNTVVGLTLGAAAVTGFALTQALPLLAGARLTDVGAVSWAALGELRARGDASFGHRVVELAATVLGMSMVIMSTVAAFNSAFVRLWVGGRHNDGAALTWATAAGMVLFSLLCLFSWLIDTQGDTRRRMWVSFAGAGVNLGLSLWLARRWGVAGVAVATVVAYLGTDAWFLPYLAVRHYGVPGGKLARALAAAAARGGAWALAMLALTRWLAPAVSWPALVAEAGLAGLLALGYGWGIVLRPADRAAWRRRWAAFSR